MGTKKDITGQVFGNFLAVREVEPKVSDSGIRYSRWECKCLKCGSLSIVYRTNLVSGHSTGCKSCSVKENMGKRKTHGMRHTRLYRTWVSMKARCNYPSSVSFKRYGALGIKVCDEWNGRDGFENFANWAMANGFIEDAPKNTCTLDRIDPSGDYCPSNCRFVSAYVQSNNRSYNIFITDSDGEQLTLKQLAKKHNINYSTIHTRWSRGKRSLSELINPTDAHGNRINRRVSEFK